jgi:putative membrane-bound dehydrogenase-like protein
MDRLLVGIAMICSCDSRAPNANKARTATPLHETTIAALVSPTKIVALRQTSCLIKYCLTGTFNMPSRIGIFALLFAAVLAQPANTFAQRGDRGKEKQPEVWKKFNLPVSPIIPPDKVLSTFRVAPNFKLELVASEPLVVDPVAMTWDQDGRLWVVEMRGYMPNVDGKGEDVLNGQIVVLEDTNDDGKMDKSTIFLEKLQMPRAIALVKGGVLVAEPPNLWYCKDTNGDLVCDEKIKAYTSYARQGPVEHTDNGLLRGFDGYLYNAKSSKRIQFALDDKGQPKITVTSSSGRGQWGITKDNYGRLYHNGNSNYISADRVIGEYSNRNPHHDGKLTSGGGGIASDQDVWPIRVNPGVNRGYRNGTLREDGRLRRTTATCGPGIYRGNQYPAIYNGDVFIPEPSGNVVSHFRVEHREDGSVKAHHQTYPDKQWEKREFIASTDERFRPINCYTGPDGCLYIVDMYRGILQHRVYVTSYLRKQIIERKLDQPVGLGRIYRMVYTGPDAKAPNKKPQMSKENGKQIAKHLEHPNGWWRDMAQRQLIERNDTTAIGEIEAVAEQSKSPFGKIHAMLTLAGLDVLDPFVMASLVESSDPKVQVYAMRLSEPLLQTVATDPNDLMDQQDLINALIQATSTKNLEVLRQLALTLGSVKGTGIAKTTRDLLLANTSHSDIRDAVISGLHQRELEFLQRLISDTAWNQSASGRSELVRDLAECIVREGNKDRIERLLNLAATQTDKTTTWRRDAILDGINTVAHPKGRKPKPLYYETQPRAMATLAKVNDKKLQDRIKKVSEFIKFGQAPAPLPPPTPLTASQQKRFDAGKEIYAKTCASCHMPSGLGEDGKAPPLIDSHWLLANDARTIRIVLHGVMGEITVHGRKYNLEMPPVQGLTDEQIASVLTYTRRQWEHRGDPIDPKQVAKVRAETQGREKGWTETELLKVK